MPERRGPRSRRWGSSGAARPLASRGVHPAWRGGGFRHRDDVEDDEGASSNAGFRRRGGARQD